MKGTRITVTPKGGAPDPTGEGAAAALAAAGVEGIESVGSGVVYLFDGDVDAGALDHLAREALADPVIDVFETGLPPKDGLCLEIAPRPGVMDPVVGTVREAASHLGIELGPLLRIRQYRVRGDVDSETLRRAAGRALARETIETVRLDDPWTALPDPPPPYRFEPVVVPLPDDEAGLLAVSTRGGLALDAAEMAAIREHFRGLGRDPTETELETIAQTWSEHCNHKTFRSPVRFGDRRYGNLLKETVFAATERIAAPWCVSVFADNAGVVAFDDRHHLCFKVETHNHPSAIEPYGGAGTGIGGVLRDILGCGLGARPVASVDVFCTGPLDLPESELPAGTLHPRRVLAGVVAGVRDYGNRMGIPTVAGAVCMHPGFVANPLVYCGTVGVLPVDRVAKGARPGDRVVVAGGRTGRDGIHGATFSSTHLDEESETVSQGAVQIGDPITERRLMDALERARDEGLYSCVTDCGAGGLSSAVGEMGESTGARVDLETVPLKYAGLTPTEIWISESQERMVFAVPQEHLDRMVAIFREEGVDCTAIGRFTDDRRLRLFYDGETVADLDMTFLHEGLPRREREACWTPPTLPPVPIEERDDWTPTLLDLLASGDICSKEWIVRQYDHEVQGGSVLKPFPGPGSGGPGDASVILPVLGTPRGAAIGCGIKTGYGRLDPARMALSALDEAIRQLIVVGADPERIALLDNFCWGDTHDPEQLGALVLAAEAIAEAAVGFGTPFVSGKDSLHNAYLAAGKKESIPPTLLVSSLGIVEEVARCVSMDLKSPGNRLVLVGRTRDELGGSAYLACRGIEGGVVPGLDVSEARAAYRAVAGAIRKGWVRSAHDLSEGGLAVAAAEMAFAGGVGAAIDLDVVPCDAGLSVATRLFSESNARLLLEVAPEHLDDLAGALKDIPHAVVGETTAGSEFVVRTGGRDAIRAGLDRLRDAWAGTLPRHLGVGPA